MFSVLLIEDSPEFQLMVKRVLGHHHVITTDDPDMVTHHLSTQKIDLIILDIGLPKRDGYSVLNEIQSHAEWSSLPVVCLTGKGNVTDKVAAFSLGADDYIQKPFEPVEFKARIDSKLLKQRRTVSVKSKLSLGDLTVDLSSHRVWCEESNAEVTLTQTEFKLLLHLGRHPGNVFSREQLLSSVWGDDGAVFDRAVDVHLCSLRKKVSPYGVQFKAVAGVGYKLILERRPVLKRVV